GGVDGLELKEENKAELMKTNRLKNHWGLIPQTVKDAFSLVKRMRKRYLWVDALCLIQDNQCDVKIGVSMMQFVYGVAMLTIVAATGKDSNADLHGVHFTTGPPERIVEICKPGRAMILLQDMDSVLATTTYASRAWT
ncbi:hypothetical protein BDW02DRAFT_456095, partial [Decorospora gaudefroyi]